MQRLAYSFKAVGTKLGSGISDAKVFLHEGSDFAAIRKLRDQLAVIPEFATASPVDISEADVGEPENTPEEIAKLRAILDKHQSIFLGSGNALPPPARGVVCDLEVEPGTKPIAQKARRIPGHLLVKVFELLKKLLEAGLIEFSESDWASPIVIVMKKNGKDIRLCIDYRMVNSLIKLMAYPLPLIDELLDNFEAVMWFLSLDMASGFWAIPMTLRAKLISAFICPLGHFQWLRMPFGLKNAPLVYQKVLDNCLWGFVRLPPYLEALVDPEVLEFLGLEIKKWKKAQAQLVIGPATVASETGDLGPKTEPETQSRDSGTRCTEIDSAEADADQAEAAPARTFLVPEAGETVFDLAIPAPRQMGPVLGRSSYIDDIAYGAKDWDQLCETLDRLLYRLRYWGISVSLPKSSFGKKSIEYLSHYVTRTGIQAKPKILQELQDLPFPRTLKGVQSFLGSLNYYHKFIEDYSIVASTLYELTDDQVREGRDLERAKESFELLKSKLMEAPVLKHPDRSKPYVVIIHANPWAISAVLGQEHDGKIFPVRFTGRTLHDAEHRYHEAEREVLALLRVLTVFYTLVAGQPLKVYTRFSVLKWLFTSKSLQGRCLQWATLLSPWDLEVHRVEKDEDGLAALLAASITPRDRLDEIAERLVPAKMSRSPTRGPLFSLEMLEANYDGYVMSFDGAAKLKTRVGSASFVLWRLPGWRPVLGHGVHLDNVTVNEAEYQGILQGLRCVAALGIQDIVVVGDSRIVIQQCQGLINCNQPHLALLEAEYQKLRACFQSIRLVHAKREFNASADFLATKALRLGASFEEDDLEQLVFLNKLPSQAEPEDASPEEQPKPSSDSEPEHQADVYAVRTRSQGEGDRQAPTEDQPGRMPGPEGEIGQAVEERWRRIRLHQESDPEFGPIIKYLEGDLEALTQAQARSIAKVADRYVVDETTVLRYVAPSRKPSESRDESSTPRGRVTRQALPRLAVPRTMRNDVLHLGHADIQAGHQGIIRTFERLRPEYYWPGMFRRVERFVKECVDCETSKGRPRNPGPSPGNITPEYPFEVVSMDFVLPLPASSQGNTSLLLFQDMFSGYIMCKAMSGTTAQEVAEAYEEMVFRRFGASSYVRHDQDPRFMSEVFAEFRRMLGSQQRATLAYRPQANGQQERSVQTVIRSVRTYCEDSAQGDWESLVERLMFALNTSYDSTRRETPFFLVHGWDPKDTVSAMLAPVPRGREKHEAYLWRLKVQREYEYAKAWARRLQSEAKDRRAAAQTRAWEELPDSLKSGFEIGDAVWLYMARVKPGLTKKLAHLWHGPFRILEKSDDFRYKLKLEGQPYRFYPWVHVSRLKPRLHDPERPVENPGEDELAPLDLDEALLPEDSWAPDEDSGEFVVEELRDVRWVQSRTRTARRRKEYLVKWAGYEEPDWVPVERLNCGALLYEFDVGARARARFQAMQSADEPSVED